VASRRRWWILAVAGIAQLMVVLDSTSQQLMRQPRRSGPPGHANTPRWPRQVPGCSLRTVHVGGNRTVPATRVGEASASAPLPLAHCGQGAQTGDQ
jgi:hypothetical protein